MSNWKRGGKVGQLGCAVNDVAVIIFVCIESRRRTTDGEKNQKEARRKKKKPCQEKKKTNWKRPPGEMCEWWIEPTQLVRKRERNEPPRHKQRHGGERDREERADNTVLVAIFNRGNFFYIFCQYGRNETLAQQVDWSLEEEEEEKDEEEEAATISLLVDDLFQNRMKKFRQWRHTCPQRNIQTWFIYYK